MGAASKGGAAALRNALLRAVGFRSGSLGKVVPLRRARLKARLEAEALQRPSSEPWMSPPAYKNLRGQSRAWRPKLFSCKPFHSNKREYFIQDRRGQPNPLEKAFPGAGFCRAPDPVPALFPYRHLVLIHTQMSSIAKSLPDAVRSCGDDLQGPFALPTVHPSHSGALCACRKEPDI